ncbi:MAG TPA: SDR family NAD(P)-dependent oxidoreductase [Ferruginibacter sp.]|nr:SDR family NAD(P)-dependent oxidoreductase [Ferruginibacter sp.]
MVILGANSEISQAFIERVLSRGERFPVVYLFSSNEENAKRIARHFTVKYQQQFEIIPFDLSLENDFEPIKQLDTELVFCASGFLGKDAATGLYDDANTQRIIAVNYSRLIVLLNHFAQHFEAKGKGTLIALTSVAGERGRQSNFIYGSAKAGFTAYLQGLRNYLFHKGVHVLTVIPGFMDTPMTANLSTPKMLTASPQKAASIIYKAWKSKKNVVYVTPIWRYIMLIIRNIPEFIFKKMKM